MLAVVLSAYLTTAGGSLATTDAVATYDVTRQMLEHGTVALSSDIVGNDAYQGQDGRLYSPFGLLQSLWNIPFYGAGRLASSLPPLRRASPVMVTKATVALGNAVAAALCVWIVWWLAWSVSDGCARTASVAAFLAGVRHVAVAVQQVRLQRAHRRLPGHVERVRLDASLCLPRGAMGMGRGHGVRTGDPDAT